MRNHGAQPASPEENATTENGSVLNRDTKEDVSRQFATSEIDLKEEEKPCCDEANTEIYNYTLHLGHQWIDY